jgi:TatD DNase family protein
VAHTAHVLAETIGVTDTEIAQITTSNFYRLFSKAASADAARSRAVAS